MSSSPPSPETGQIPYPAEIGSTARRTAFRRLADSVADPVLRILVVSTFVSTLGRGVFLTLTVLYFTLIVGLSAVEIAVVLTVSSAVGAATSVLGGHLADRFSARRIFVAFEFIGGVALTCYVLADTFASALALACLYRGASQAAHSASAAIIARAFDGGGRVGARAVLRTVTNIGIAIGGAVAGVPLLVGSAGAYRTTMIVAGLVMLLSVIPLLRLPARVNAPTLPKSPGAPRIRMGRSPFRDGRYLGLTVLSGIFGLHFGLAEIGLPLWILHSTDAPIAMMSVLLITNTIIVIAFQIPLSRGTDDVRYAGKVTAIAGVLMAGACFVYAASGAVSIWFAVAFLVVAALAHAFAEVLSSGGAWGLSFELADPHRAGAYQGVFGLGWSLSSMAAPLVVTAAVTNGLLGWTALAILFLLAALGVWWIAHHASTVPVTSPA